MRIKNLYTLLTLSLFVLFGIIGCSEDDDSSTTETRSIVQSFDVPLSYRNSIPAVEGRSETGNIIMDLYDDNTLAYTINVNNLLATDNLTIAHVHAGDVVSTGDVLISLANNDNLAFSGGSLTAMVTLTEEQVGALQGDDVYVNIHSELSPAGLLRGQIDKDIVGAYNALLSPENEIPAVEGRSETGEAYIRIIGSIMYYKIIVNDLDESDSITAGHIHQGSATENGDVIINLEITNEDELNVTKTLMLSEDLLNSLMNDDLYINVHSVQQALGLLRGQVM